MLMKGRTLEALSETQKVRGKPGKCGIKESRTEFNKKKRKKEREGWCGGWPTVQNDTEKTWGRLNTTHSLA